MSATLSNADKYKKLCTHKYLLRQGSSRCPDFNHFDISKKYSSSWFQKYADKNNKYQGSVNSPALRILCPLYSWTSSRGSENILVTIPWCSLPKMTRREQNYHQPDTYQLNFCFQVHKTFTRDWYKKSPIVSWHRYPESHSPTVWIWSPWDP